MNSRTKTFARRDVVSSAEHNLYCLCAGGYAQGNGYERAFPQSKATIEKSCRRCRLLDACRCSMVFAISSATDRPLDRYRRGYYQSKFSSERGPSGGSVVRVVVQVTAWYTDPVASRSGYQLLNSNGRIEGDVLDQLCGSTGANTSQPGQSPFQGWMLP